MPLPIILFMSLPLIVLCGIGVYFLTDDSGKRREAFKDDIKQGIENNMLAWEDLAILSKRWNQSRTDVYWILSDLLHESLAQKKDDNKGEGIYQRVKDLIKQQELSEPYAELPESIRMHLENIASLFSENRNDILRPLVSSICDTIIEAAKKREKQGKLTKMSLLVGLISLSIGIASLVFAINQIQR